jgi:hypothetical protein
MIEFYFILFFLISLVFYSSISTEIHINKCILMCKDIWMMKTVPFLSFLPSFFFFLQNRHIHFPFHSTFYYYCSRRSSGGWKTEERINSLYPSFFFATTSFFWLCLNDNYICIAQQDLFFYFITSLISIFNNNNG